MMNNMFGFFLPGHANWPIVAQPGSSEDAAPEAAIQPMLLRNSLRVCPLIFSSLGNWLNGNWLNGNWLNGNWLNGNWLNGNLSA
jgi:hypothetical protein